MNHFEAFELIKNNYPALNRIHLKRFLEFSNLIELPKKEIITSEGRRHSYFYFLIQGAAKSYYLKDGKEVCAWFAFENEVIGNLNVYKGKPSNETIELIENSVMICLHIEKIKELSKSDILLKEFLHDMIIEHALFLEERLFQLQYMSSKERHQKLLKQEPLLYQRVSINDIASYLGISRETLSRIRAQK